MDFYTIVLIVAIILLIATLTGLSLMLTKVGTTTSFPTYSNTCPDGWTDSSGVCTSRGANVPKTYPIGTSSWSSNSTGYINYFYTSGNYPSSTITASTSGSPNYTLNGNITLDTSKLKLVCDQQTWAKANKITWDGVTNNNVKC